MNFGKIFNMISDKNIDQGELFSLIDSVRNMDFTDETNLRNVIQKVSLVANRTISPEQEDSLVSKIKKDGIPDDIFSLF